MLLFSKFILLILVFLIFICRASRVCSHSLSILCAIIVVLSTRIHTHTYIYIYIYIYIYQKGIYIYIYIYRDIHIYIYIYIYFKIRWSIERFVFFEFIYFVLTYVLCTCITYMLYICMIPACCFRQRTCVAQGLLNGVLNETWTCSCFQYKLFLSGWICFYKGFCSPFLEYVYLEREKDRDWKKKTMWKPIYIYFMCSLYDFHHWEIKIINIPPACFSCLSLSLS